MGVLVSLLDDVLVGLLVAMTGIAAISVWLLGYERQRGRLRVNLGVGSSISGRLHPRRLGVLEVGVRASFFESNLITYTNNNFDADKNGTN
jgi:hypothetical protein